MSVNTETAISRYLALIEGSFGPDPKAERVTIFLPDGGLSSLSALFVYDMKAAPRLVRDNGSEPECLIELVSI
jgi:hypothetical protein